MKYVPSWESNVSSRFSFWTCNPAGSTPMIATRAKAITATAIAISIIVKPLFAREHRDCVARIIGSLAFPHVPDRSDRRFELGYNCSLNYPAEFPLRQRELRLNPGFDSQECFPEPRRSQRLVADENHSCQRSLR